MRFGSTRMGHVLLPLYLPSVSPVAHQTHPFYLCPHPAGWPLHRGLRLKSLNPYDPEAQLQVHHQALHLSLSQYKSWDPCSSAGLNPPGATLWHPRVRQPWPHPLPAVHFVDTHGPPGDSAFRSCQHSFGFRNQIQTSFTRNKKELMISWEVLKSLKVKPPSDMAEPNLLAFPGVGLTLISTLGALRRLCIGLLSSLQLSPCCLDS